MLSITRWPAVVAAAAAIVTTGTACGAYQQRRQAAVPATSSVASSPRDLSAQDKTWLAQAHQGNVAEIEAGQLAQDKSGSPQIQSEAATLVTDHTQLDQAVVSTAERFQVGLPGEPTADQAAQQEQLGAITGAAFDNQFIAYQISGHEQALAGTNTEVAQGSDPTVRALARQAVPVIQRHLAMLKQGRH
ncbi:DUF4142 domain-containing protein [Actinomadura harenae]|uniref:DUF4142 domain-containing protein n=1 Tax=Actinomadura harenae TaxID=2483351 RepID=A0A3M2LHJ4_9ACTN|nr:DUF4142 domain-containing protein [Actinomadura harenae]RMI36576.1 DUF4142 domain-containing protein [Actinomadura harenae]